MGKYNKLMKAGPGRGHRKIPLTIDPDSAIAEYKRRALVRSNLESELFKQQLDFVNDTSKLKAIFCPRRSGKSWALGVNLIMQALLYPDRKLLYLGLSQLSAENVMWDHIILLVLEKYKIPFSYNKNRKTVTFKNKSTIRFGGVDANPHEMKKLLGGKYHLVIIDECQDITQDLKMLIENDVGPAVKDYIKADGGIIICAGTPGMHMGEHYWFQITKTDINGLPSQERMKGWSVHEWQVVDNPYMIDEFGMMIDELQKNRGPMFREDPTFRSQWLGQWVIEANKLVYKYDHKRNNIYDPPGVTSQSELIKKLLNRTDKQFTYIMGVDLGWEDATAFVIGAYSSIDTSFYIVESSKQNHTNLAQIAAILVSYQKKYNINRMILDTGGGGKLAAESLREQYMLPIYPAEKTEKEAAIARMNSDMICSLVKVIPETNEALIKEWQELLIDKKMFAKGVFKEAEKFHNHLADAALYAFKDALHFHGKVPEAPKEPDFADQVIKRAKQLRSSRIREDRDYYSDRYDKLEDEQETQRLIKTFRLAK